MCKAEGYINVNVRFPLGNQKFNELQHTVAEFKNMCDDAKNKIQQRKAAVAVTHACKVLDYEEYKKIMKLRKKAAKQRQRVKIDRRRKAELELQVVQEQDLRKKKTLIKGISYMLESISLQEFDEGITFDEANVRAEAIRAKVDSQTK